MGDKEELFGAWFITFSSIFLCIVIFQYLVTVCSFCSVEPAEHTARKAFMQCSCAAQVCMDQKSFQKTCSQLTLSHMSFFDSVSQCSLCCLCLCVFFLIIFFVRQRQVTRKLFFGLGTLWNGFVCLAFMHQCVFMHVCLFILISCVDTTHNTNSSPSAPAHFLSETTFRPGLSGLRQVEKNKMKSA